MARHGRDRVVGGDLVGRLLTGVGDHFRSAGASPDVWPHDGLVALSSALATAVPRAVLPNSPAMTFNDVHSLFFANAFGLPEHKALTWDPDVHHAVDAAIGAADLSD